MAFLSLSNKSSEQAGSAMHDDHTVLRSHSTQYFSVDECEHSFVCVSKDENMKISFGVSTHAPTSHAHTETVVDSPAANLVIKHSDGATCKASTFSARIHEVRNLSYASYPTEMPNLAH